MNQDNALPPEFDPDATRPNAAGAMAIPPSHCDDDTTIIAASVVKPEADEYTQLVAPYTATQSLPWQAEPTAKSASLSQSSSTFSASRGPSQLKKLAEEAAAMQLAPVPHYDGPSSSMALPPGFSLFEYRIDKVLGQGSFGITYLATDINLNVQVAIKEYLPTHCAVRSSDYSVVVRWPEASESYLSGLDAFLMEARTLATFQHPNIVGVARFFEAYQTAYIVLDYEEGLSLKQWWKPSRPANEAWLVEILQPLLDGLALVHDSGYLHRDIKPDNIYSSASDGHLVLLDFGAARQSVGGEQGVADVLTPGYAPVEQYEGGQQGPWTDIYAFGATLYWMIAGKKPDLAQDRLSGAALMPPAVEVGAGRYGRAFLDAIDWALQPKAPLRPQSVRAFAAALFADHAGTLNLQDALSKPLSPVRGGRGAKRSYLSKLWRCVARLAHPPGWRLTAKMTVLMMIAAMGPLLVTSYYNYQSASASVTRSELLNLEGLAQSTAGRISLLVANNRTFAAYLASDTRYIDYLNQPSADKREVLMVRLMDLISSNADVHLAFLLDSHGNALLSSDKTLDGKNFSYRQYFKQAMLGKPYTSGIVVGNTVGMPGVYFSNPVRDRNGTVIGVVVLRLKGASITAILNEIQAHESELVPMIVDTDGMLVSYPDTSKLYSSLQALPAATEASFIAEQRFRRSRFENLNMPILGNAVMHASTPGNLRYFSTLNHVDEVAGFAPVKGIGLTVVVSESHRRFEAPLRRLFINTLYTVAAVGLFFVLMVIGLSRSIVRPVQQMIAATESLRNGEFEKAKIPVSNSRHIDEVGQLARTFNIMIDVLHQRERQRDAASARSLGKARKPKS